MNNIDRERSLDDMLRELGIDSMSEQADIDYIIEDSGKKEDELSQGVDKISEQANSEIKRVDDETISDVIKLIELAVNIFKNDEEMLRAILIKLKEQLVTYVRRRYGDDIAKILELMLVILSKE